METMRQLVPGSGEGQHTETADDYHSMKGRRRMPCSLLPSSLPFPTIPYPLVCWGGGLNKYQRHAGDGFQRPLRSRFQPRLMPGAHHYTFLESLNGPMRFHRIDEFMEALIALPDRLDARLTVSRAG
jgi:hypothetical protein